MERSRVTNEKLGVRHLGKVEIERLRKKLAMYDTAAQENPKMHAPPWKSSASALRKLLRGSKASAPVVAFFVGD